MKEAHEELLERLTAIEEKLEELSAINSNDELRRKLKNVPYQLECMRRLQQIEGDLRELRTNAATAKVAKEGESGYIPEQSLPLDESKARSSTIWDFSYIEERLDKFILPEYQRDPTDPDLSLIGLCVNLERLQRSVREEAQKSAMRSLNEIAFSGVCLARELHEMLDQIDGRYKDLERAKQLEDKRNEGLQWASERKQRGQLPLPD